MFPKTFFVIASLAVSVAACQGSPRPAYAPVTTTGANFVGHAEYPFPPNAPHGRVSVATLGVGKVGQQTLVHLRITATNEGPDKWTIDKREQRLEIAMRDQQQLIAPRTDLDDSPPSVEVATGETKPVDLFFPLPPAARGTGDGPSFTALWTVQVGERAVSMATPFERLVTVTPPPS
jgi:hypothetical protein